MQGDAPDDPSVATALDWFFDSVLPNVSDGDKPIRDRLSRANCIFFAVDPDCTTYVGRAASATAAIGDTHVRIPFAILRTFFVQLPQHCLVGTLMVTTTMLPQGSAISCPCSILQAAYQRSLKFDSLRVPADIRTLMVDYPIQYVDDSLV